MAKSKPSQAKQSELGHSRVISLGLSWLLPYQVTEFTSSQIILLFFWEHRHLHHQKIDDRDGAGLARDVLS
jgi:hypothetical protein